MQRKADNKRTSPKLIVSKLKQDCTQVEGRASHKYLSKYGKYSYSSPKSAQTKSHRTETGETNAKN